MAYFLRSVISLLLVLLMCAFQVQTQDSLTAQLTTAGSTVGSSVEEATGFLEVCVSLSDEPVALSPLSVNVVSTDGFLSLTPTTAGMDYTALDETFVFSTGDGTFTQCVNITLFEDGLTEGIEFFQISATSSVPVAGSPAIITLFNSDGVTVGFQQDTYTFIESQGGMVCLIILEGGLEIDADVTISTQAGTAQGGDFLSTPITLELAAGSTVANAPVCSNITIFDNAAVEGTENFTLSLGGVSVDPATGTTTVNIVDDDFVTLELMDSELRFLEGNGTSPQGVNVSVVISNIPVEGLERDVVGLLRFTLGTAGLEDVVVEPEVMVVFPAAGTSNGDTVQGTFYILPDLFEEEDEQFTVTLSAVAPDVTGTQTTLIITIENDDVTPDCGSLDEVEDGNIEFSMGTLYGSTATYTCDNGFVLTGDSERMCQFDATWTGSDPECTVDDRGRIIGIAVGVSIGGAVLIALVLIIIIVIACCVYRKKKSEKYVLNYSTVYGQRSKVPLSDSKAVQGGGEAANGGETESPADA